jgi:superfamily I DNA/RNA helicase
VVLLIDANRGCFPRLPSELADHERPFVDETARRDLHLAMTRATEELVVVATEATRAPALPMKLLNVERLAAPPAEAAPDVTGDERAAAVTS